MPVIKPHTVVVKTILVTDHLLSHSTESELILHVALTSIIVTDKSRYRSAERCLGTFKWYQHGTRCDQKVLSLIHFKAFHKTKSLFSLSFYLIKSHLESKKHLVTLDCFFTTVLREDSASSVQNGEI